MRNLYNIFHISANTKYVKGDGDVMLEKMVEEVVERKMLELVGDRDKVAGRALGTDYSSVMNTWVPTYCLQTRYCVASLVSDSLSGK